MRLTIIMAILFFSQGLFVIGQQKKTFILKNNTGLTLNEIYLYESSNEDYTINLIENHNIPHGESAEISMPADQEVFYSITAFDSEEFEFTWSNINFKNVTKITLSLNSKGNPTIDIVKTGIKNKRKINIPE